MIRFGVTYGNHGNGVHVEDVVVHIRNALRSAGQEAYVLPHFVRDGVNVLLECFAANQAAQINRIKRTTGARFVVVVSEFTDGKTFNSHITSGQGHYVDLEVWQQRFAAFLEVASHADAIWTLSKYQVEQYRALFSNKPVMEFPIGFDDLYPTPHHPPPESKDIDLVFTGNETPYRRETMSRLARRHTVLMCPVSTLNSARVDILTRSKASLHVNIAPNQSYTSVMRHHFLLMNASPVLSERATHAGELDDFVRHFDAAECVSEIADYLAGGSWIEDGITAHKRYREARPLASAARTLLRETLQM